MFELQWCQIKKIVIQEGEIPQSVSDTKHLGPVRIHIVLIAYIGREKFCIFSPLIMVQKRLIQLGKSDGI